MRHIRQVPDTDSIFLMQVMVTQWKVSPLLLVGHTLPRPKLSSQPQEEKGEMG
jgi:hypothetical protein